MVAISAQALALRLICLPLTLACQQGLQFTNASRPAITKRAAISLYRLTTHAGVPSVAGCSDHRPMHRLIVACAAAPTLPRTWVDCEARVMHLISESHQPGM